MASLVTSRGEEQFRQFWAKFFIFFFLPEQLQGEVLAETQLFLNLEKFLADMDNQHSETLTILTLGH